MKLAEWLPVAPETFVLMVPGGMVVSIDEFGNNNVKTCCFVPGTVEDLEAWVEASKQELDRIDKEEYGDDI